jgi:hypothetical protein
MDRTKQGLNNAGSGKGSRKMMEERGVAKGRLPVEPWIAGGPPGTLSKTMIVPT